MEQQGTERVFAAELRDARSGVTYRVLALRPVTTAQAFRVVSECLRNAPAAAGPLVTIDLTSHPPTVR